MYTDDDILGPSLDLRVVKLYIECSLYIDNACCPSDQ